MADRHEWGTVTEQQKSGGDPNVLQLGDQVRIRLIEPSSVKWRQHAIESPTDDEQFRSVTCPRGPDGRNDMPCPLCMKPADAEGNQRFDISRRHATNVWAYNKDGKGGEVKVLIGGPQIFKEFDAVAKMGIDPTLSDWTIFKMGTGKQTSYKTVRLDASPFEHAAECLPEHMHDLDKYADPPSVEAIFKVLEDLGIDYDSLEMPSFTLDKAEAFQMPYGQHKGMTIEQLHANDPDYLSYLYNAKRDQGNYGDPVFVAMHTVLEHYGEVEPLEALVAPPKPAASAPASTPAGTPAASDTVTLVGPSGEHMEAPAGAVDALLTAGYKRPEPEPTPEPAATTSFPLTLVGPDGSEVQAENEAVLAALTGAGYTPKPVPVAASDPSPEPAEPADDDEVQIDISGQAATMAYGQAKSLIASGVATLIGTTADGAVAPEPASQVPEPPDDEQVQFSLKVMPAGASVAMPWRDAKRLFLEDQGDFIGDQADNLRTFARASQNGDSDADVKAEVAAAAAADQHPPAGSPSNLDPSLTITNDDGTFQHPALPKKDYKSKGAITQALNKLRTQGAPPAPTANGGGAPAEGREGLMGEVRSLLAQVPSVSGDFNKLMKLFEETGGKRNIQEFDDSGLQALKTELEKRIAAGTSA